MKKEQNSNYKKEDDSMNAVTMERAGYKRLNFSELNFSDSQCAEKKLEEITPVNWSKEVLAGNKRVFIRKK